MFNYTGSQTKYSVGKGYGGMQLGEFDTHYTLYAGVDPANPQRALIRKVVKVSPTTFCYEEVRITPGESKPTVHSQLFRVKDFNLHEYLSPEELQIRGAFRAMPNVMGFSLFFRGLNKGGTHLSIIENTLNKRAGGTWTEWF